MKNEKAYLKKLALDEYTDEDVFYTKLKNTSKIKKGSKKAKNKDEYEGNF
jgi:hypothetical protein